MTNNQSTGITMNVVNHHHGHHDQQQEDNDSLSTNHIKMFKPRYLRMSDKVFKQMLSNEIEHDDNTIQCLDTSAVQLTLMSAHVSVSERKPNTLTVSLSALPLTLMVSASGECSPLMSAHMSVSGSYFYCINKFLKLRASFYSY